MTLTIYDYLLFPLYFFLLLLIVKQRSKKLETSELRKYFMRMFLMHVTGAFLHTMVVVYYYGSGDMFGYMQGGEFLKQSVFSSGHSLGVFFLSGSEISQLPGSDSLNIFVYNSLFTSSSLSAIKFSGVFSIFSFSHLLINALFCGFLSFAGLWKLFRVFDDISLHKFQKPLALLLIYTPTVWFWGSGLGKDSISLGLLGLLIGAVYGLIKRKKIIANLLTILICSFLLAGLKGVLLALLAAAASGYVAVYLLNKTKNTMLRFIIMLLFLSSFAVFFISSLNDIQNSLDDIKDMVESNIATYSTESGDGAFEPPEFTFTPAGIAAAIPKTVFSTFYRPFIWEVRKPIMFFSALESLLMMLSFFYVLFKGGVRQFFKTLFTDPATMFSFIFCTLLAMIVGFTTFNLGTLVRYRLPLLPFYLFMILSFLQAAKKKKQQRSYIPLKRFL